jgi:tRNA(Ile)-lysidine synthase
MAHLAPDLYRDFKIFITDNHLLTADDRILIAVSGGVDSMVLLHLFLRLRSENGLPIQVVHLNHSLRGCNADKDEQLVSDYCSNNRCIFYSEKIDVKQYAREKHLSLEVAGREVRYSLFQHQATSSGCSLIATAHTLDDQVETILFRIIKGTGLKGLEGIRTKRGNIIRPLLFATKQQIYDYARKHQIPFNEDHTNRDKQIPRNYIRHQLIPSIRSGLNPAFEDAILNLSAIARDANAFIQPFVQKALEDCIIETTKREITLDISRLKRYFTTVKIEVIRECLKQLKFLHSAGDYKMLTRITQLIEIGSTGKQLKIGPEWSAYINRNQLILEHNSTNHWSPLQIEPGKAYQTEYFRFVSKVVNISKISLSRTNRNLEYIDLNDLGRQITLRPWNRGDRIKPVNTSFTKKVSDLFIDNKISLNHKKRIPILESDGTIVWICGLQLSDNFKIKPKTVKALKLYYEELD